MSKKPNVRSVPLFSLELVEESVRELAKRGRSILLCQIEVYAQDVIRRYPFVDDYAQSMGSAVITVTLNGTVFLCRLEDGCSAVFRHFIYEDLHVDIKTSLTNLDRDLRKMHKIHELWGTLFSGSLAGEPLTVSKSGTFQ